MSLLNGGPSRGLVPIGGLLGRTQNVQKDPIFQFLYRIKHDINYYFKLIGFDPTWQQRELVEAFVEGYANIAVRSGKGPGKTAATAALIPWWSLTNIMSQAVVTAPTEAQCKNVWLSQAQKWVMDGDPQIRYFYNYTGKGYGIRKHKNELWGCYIRTATRPENFQGIHNERLLIYCEEASGVSRPIMQAIQDTLTGNKGNASDAEKLLIEEDKKARELDANTQVLQDALNKKPKKKKQVALNRWLCVGNPNTRTCRFFDFFHSLANNPWKAIHWNAEDTPITNWFSGERNKEIEEEFGKDSDVYRVAVLGDFPSLDPNALISEIDLNKCFGSKAYTKAFSHPDKKKQIGVDLARYGGDECVAIYRNGRICLSMEAQPNIDPNTWIDRSVMYQDQLHWQDKDCVYVVDTSGMGEAAVGRLGSKRRMGKRVHEFYSQNTAYESAKYANKITEAWCGFAKMVRSGDLYLGEKPDRRLVLQLTNRFYSIDNDGRIKIETKDEYKKRMADNDTGGELGKSPDRADGMVMAFYEHASDSARVALG
jgi:hypothetical protein